MKFSSPKRNGIGLAHMRDSSVSIMLWYRNRHYSQGGRMRVPFLAKRRKNTLNSVGSVFSHECFCASVNTHC